MKGSRPRIHDKQTSKLISIILQRGTHPGLSVPHVVCPRRHPLTSLGGGVRRSTARAGSRQHGCRTFRLHFEKQWQNDSALAPVFLDKRGKGKQSGKIISGRQNIRES